MSLTSWCLDGQAAPRPCTLDLQAHVNVVNCLLVNIYSAWALKTRRRVWCQTAVASLYPASSSFIVRHLSPLWCRDSQHVSAPPAHVNSPLFSCRSSGGLQSQPIGLLVQLHALLFRRSCAVWDHAGRAPRGAFVQQHQRPAGIHHLVNIWWTLSPVILYLMKNITFSQVVVIQLLVKTVLWLLLLVNGVIAPHVFRTTQQCHLLVI